MWVPDDYILAYIYLPIEEVARRGGEYHPS
jgi:hypothetical protein